MVLGDPMKESLEPRGLMTHRLRTTSLEHQPRGLGISPGSSVLPAIAEGGNKPFTKDKDGKTDEGKQPAGYDILGSSWNVAPVLG